MTGIGTKKYFSLLKNPVRLQVVAPLTYIFVKVYSCINQSAASQLLVWTPQDSPYE
jgi:hypothetical protein